MLTVFFTVIGSHVIWGRPPLDALEPVPPPKDVAEVKPPEPLPTSIFFTPEEQEQISAAENIYQKTLLAKANPHWGKGGSDFLDQLTNVEPKEEVEKPKEQRTYVFPQFFLNSLVYHTPNDWFVLVNNQRFSSGVSYEGAALKIVGLDDEAVSLEWRPENLEQVSKSWENTKNDQVIFDKVKGTVTFTLRPNQTFSSYVMRVLEGKVRPVVIVITADNNGKMDAAAPQEADQPPVATKNDDNKKNENITTDEIKNDVGVNAVNKTYKKIGLEN